MLEEIVNRKKTDLKFFQMPRQEYVPHYSLQKSLAFAGIHDGIGLIAEIKRASPSKGEFASDLDIISRAKAYEAGGADAISVLTDQPYFQGALTDLITVKKAVGLPVLRKDFIIDERQIEESARIGADAILLIASILEPNQILEFSKLAKNYGLESLVEVHTKNELDRLLDVYEPPLIGINNRNLKTFKTDLNQTIELFSHVPEQSLVISESGIHTAEDVSTITRAGAKAMLMGERLVTDGDPETVIPELKKGAQLA
ncbi:indole-3-glycerol phosphate synthase [Geomicrobium halophilum]|uniref:Indole-3-glycerol phosphate synthase n=1 Tax=Geomicrobium halophilum TaxID=549000 RepID=A0A841PXW1_9BACL|nr:indole-3-glycerol phosphate synthase TrpC [Geomicrobium halophilum]MBB6449042.1 indole-3-glycerol phosphate synthase [Geomicrobium halophilum]